MHKRIRGASVAIVLALVTVMSFLAAAMTALFMMSVNLTQGSFNGDVALNEAEAGVNEVLYHLGQTEDHAYGKGNQVIRATHTPGFTAEEAYHVVTFDPSSTFPHSLNNIGASGSGTGYGGRQVPADCVHVISTGVCRGQTRTVEAVIRKPPAPFGLGTSGSIRSASSLVVKGSSGGAVTDDRPGHIVANAPEGLVIDGANTYISGFAKSCGPISIAQPAEVKGGLRPNASTTELPEISIDALNPQAQTGVVNMLDSTYGAATLDIMYYCGHDLAFTGQVTMKDSFLFVNGNLQISGGVKGKGAIVVTGDVTIDGGVALSSANDMEVALIAKGMITLRGGSNAFRGLVYSGKGAEVKNMTVIGTTVVNSGDTTGSAALDGATFISQQPTDGKIEFTAKSRQSMTGGSATLNPNQVSLPISALAHDEGSGVFGSPGGGLNEKDLRDGKLTWILFQGGSFPSTVEGLTAMLTSGNPNTTGAPPFPVPVPAGWGGPSYDGLVTTHQAMVTAANAHAVLLEDITALQSELADLEDDVPPDQSAIDSTRNAIAAKQSQAATQKTTAESLAAQYVSAVTTFNDACIRYFETHVDANGYGTEEENGRLPPDFERTFTFDFNKYFPASSHCHIAYWHVTRGRL